MVKDASEALGAPQVAGTNVTPKGFTRKMTMRVAGGEIAGVAGTLAAMRSERDVPDIPTFKYGYLAASEQDVAIVKTSQLAMTPKPTKEVLAMAPRSELVDVTLDKGLNLSKLKLEFADGQVWEFEVARSFRKAAVHFVETLGGAVD
jgi:hypothetical protein